MISNQLQLHGFQQI